MTLSLRSSGAKLMVTVFAFGACAYVTYRIGAQAYVGWCIKQSTKTSLDRALALDPGNCGAEYRLGLHYSFVLTDLDLKRGQELLRTAVRCQPLDSQYWLALAATLEASGDLPEAKAAAQKVSALESHNSVLLWRSGNLLLRMGQLPEAFDLFHRVLEGAPEYLPLVFSTCWKSTDDGDLILHRAVPDTVDSDLAYLDFLSLAQNLDLNALQTAWGRSTGSEQEEPTGKNFDQVSALIRSKGTPEEIHAWDKSVKAALQPRLDEAEKVWDRLLALGEEFDPKKSFNFFQSLLEADRPQEAVKAWDKLVARGILPRREQHLSNDLIVNGGFEAEPINGGLDWRIDPVGGVLVTNDRENRVEGGRSLSVHFEGLRNLDFKHVSQFVPVKPNTVYYFSAFLKSRALSTLSGPHFEIYDYWDDRRDERTGERKVSWKTPEVLGDTEWTKYQLTIHTGPKTGLLVVSLRRQPALELDKRIQGTMWVDDVRLSTIPDTE